MCQISSFILLFSLKSRYVVHMCNLYKPQSQRASSQAYPLDDRSVLWYPNGNVVPKARIYCEQIGSGYIFSTSIPPFASPINPMANGYL